MKTTKSSRSRWTRKSKEIENSDNESDVKELNPKVEKFRQTIKHFVTTYKLAVIGFVVMFLFVIMGNMITSSERSAISNVQEKIYELDTNYDTLKRTPKVALKARMESTLDTDRWKADDNYVLSFVTNAFEHTSPTEYKSHCEEYAGTSYNITDLQGMYFLDKSGPVYSGGKYVGDASDLLSSRIIRFSSYVESVEADKYTYVAVLEIEQNVYKDQKLVPTPMSVMLRYSCKNPVNNDVNYNVDIVDMTADWIFENNK